MDPKLEDARMEIASEIGADIGYFTPPEEKHFIGTGLAIGLGGVFLSAFFKGFVKTAGERLGRELGEYLLKQIDELFRKDHPAQDQLLEDAKREAQGTIRKAGLTKEQIHSLAVAVEEDLAKVLAARAPSDVSARIAHKVAGEAVNAL